MAGQNILFYNFSGHKIVRGLSLGLSPYQMGGWSVFQARYSSGAWVIWEAVHRVTIQILWYQDSGYQNCMIFTLQEKQPHQTIEENSGCWKPLGTSCNKPLTNSSWSPKALSGYLLSEFLPSKLPSPFFLYFSLKMTINTSS